MKEIIILSYNQWSIGIKVIVDAMTKILGKEYNVRVVRKNSDLNKNDIVIPYGPKETLYALRNGYNVPISLMVDYYSLLLRNTIQFLIRKGYIFNRIIIKSIIAYFYYYIAEIYIYKKCRNLMFVSQSDINKLKKRFPENSYFCVPNGVVLPPVNILKNKVPNDKISLGILSVWTPRIFLESKWFIDLIWPKILKKFPNAEIVICGKYASDSMKEYFNSQPNVRFIGEVENLATFFNQIDIYLATKTIGCGILNKVLDAMAYKRLVIGVGASFTGFTYMKDSFIICDKVDDYVEIIKKYADNPSSFNYIIENAYNNIKTYNNWDINYYKFIEELHSKNILPRD